MQVLGKFTLVLWTDMVLQEVIALEHFYFVTKNSYLSLLFQSINSTVGKVSIT